LVAQVPREPRGPGERHRPGARGPQLRPSRPATWAGRRHQRPVRPKWLRARPRPAPAPSLRAARRAALRPPRGRSAGQGGRRSGRRRDRYDPEGHDHRAEPEAVPPDLRRLPGVGPALLQHLRHRRDVDDDRRPLRRAAAEDDAGSGSAGMSLVNPSALLLAGLAVPIVVFYILKIRLRRVPVSTLLFWQQIFVEKKPRSLWQRLRHLISLLLQLAFLALLVFAVADPIFRWQQARARRMVLIVDNSASMNARDVSPSRLDAAKSQGRQVIDGLRPGDELAIIAAGAQPRVACGTTDHQRTLRAALDSIPTSDGPTRIAEAVTLARRLLSR